MKKSKFISIFASITVIINLFLSVPVYAANNPPTVITYEASGISQTSAILKAEITLNGGAAITEYGFCWGINSGNPENKEVVGTSNYKGSFSKDISGLKPGKTYYFYAYAKNSAGKGTGKVLSFITDSKTPSDTTAPELAISPKGGTVKVGSTITVSASDPSGINHIGYAWDGDNTTPVYNSTASIQVPDRAGTHTLHYYAKDNSSNYNFTGWNEVSYVIEPEETGDTTAPELAISPKGGTVKVGSTITVSASDPSGVNHIGYAWDGDNTTPVYNSTASIQVPDRTGTHTLHYYAKDNSSNYNFTGWNEVSYVIEPEETSDTTAPELAISPKGGTVKVGSTITISASDPSGINHIGYAWDGDNTTPVYNSAASIQVPDRTGTHTLHYYAKDNSSNYNFTGWNAMNYTIESGYEAKPTLTLTGVNNNQVIDVGKKITLSAASSNLKYIQYYWKSVDNPSEWGQIGRQFVDENETTVVWDTTGKKAGKYIVKVQGLNMPDTEPVMEVACNITLTAVTEDESVPDKELIVKPANGSTLDYANLTITWNKVSWVQKYKVTIEDLENNRYVFSKELSAKSSSVQISKSIFENWHQYKIWLAGIDKNNIQQSLGYSVIWISHDYKNGESGDFVKEIQKRLIGKGYKLSNGVNGKVDSKTTDAVNAFKKANGLLNTGVCYGVVGKDTWNKLKSGIWLVYGDKGDKVNKLQKMLISLGYNMITKADSDFGQKTLKAVNKFKNDNKIYNDREMNGIVGDQVWTLLVKKSSSTGMGVKTANKSKNAANYIRDLVKQEKASLFYSTMIDGRQYGIYRITGAYIIQSDNSPYGFTLSANTKYKPNELWKVKNNGYYFIDEKNNALVTDVNIIKKIETIQNANFEFLLNMQLKRIGGDPFAQALNDIQQTRSIRESCDFWKTWCDVCSNLTASVAGSWITGTLGAKTIAEGALKSIGDVAQSKISVKTLLHGVCVGVFNACEDNICSLKTLHEQYENKWHINYNDPNLFLKGYIDNYNDAQLYLEYSTYMKVYYATSKFDDNVGGYTEDYGWGDYLKDTWGNFLNEMMSKVDGEHFNNLPDWEKKVAVFFQKLKTGQDIFEAMGVFDIKSADTYSKQINLYFNSSYDELDPDYFNSLTYNLIN